MPACGVRSCEENTAQGCVEGRVNGTPLMAVWRVVWREHRAGLCGGNSVQDCVEVTQFRTVWREHRAELCGGNSVQVT